MDDLPPSLPEPDPASSVISEDTPQEDSDGSANISHLPAEHRDAMQRLYHRVEEAVETIERLRTKNRELRERVEELEARPTFPEDDTVLAINEDPEELRAQITDFIDAIDTYLESSPSDDEDSPADDTPPALSTDDSTDDPEA